MIVEEERTKKHIWSTGVRQQLKNVKDAEKRELVRLPSTSAWAVVTLVVVIHHLVGMRPDIL
jgi:hypothetical protein